MFNMRPKHDLRCAIKQFFKSFDHSTLRICFWREISNLRYENATFWREHLDFLMDFCKSEKE